MGGMSKVVYDLIGIQRKNSHLEVSLAIGSIKGDFLNDFQSLGIKIHILNFKSGYDLSLTKINKFKRLVESFDIVHFHNHDYRLCRPFIKIGAKIVSTEHGVFGLYRKKNPCNLIKIRSKSQFLKKYCNFI